jgi:hypothetical protein
MLKPGRQRRFRRFFVEVKGLGAYWAHPPRTIAKKRRELCDELRHFAVVILEQSAKALPTLDGPGSLADFGTGLQNLVAQALVVPFGVVMANVLFGGSDQSTFAEKDHAI